MAKIYKDGKFFKYYKENWFNPIGMTDDGYYIHVPSTDSDEYQIVKEHGRLKAFHPSSKWSRESSEIEPAGLFVTKNFTGRWYYIDTEITDKELANKENWMSENIRRREEFKTRKEENIKNWKAKVLFKVKWVILLNWNLALCFRAVFLRIGEQVTSPLLKTRMQTFMLFGENFGTTKMMNLWSKELRSRELSRSRVTMNAMTKSKLFFKTKLKILNLFLPKMHLGVDFL